MRKQFSGLYFFVKLIILFILFYNFASALQEVSCNRIKLAKQEQTIEQKTKENKEKDIRIDQVAQIVTDLAERYTGIGQGFQEVLIDLKENRTIGIDQKIADLPDDMYQIFVARNIMMHGIEKYKIFDSSYIYPMKESTSYIPSKWGEFGWRPKLFDENTYEYVYRSGVRITEWVLHNGGDVVNPYDPEVFASKDGKIISIGESKAAGKYIIIEHKEEGKPLRQTRCFHLYEILVEKNQIVKQGEIIGLVGKTGKKLTGTHLHFELKEMRNGRWMYKNFFVGTTHNRKWMAGYYWIKTKNGRWIIKTL